ncbi:MAG TPA: hypothetical protein PKY59_06780 [Pyrinomonadaceae bacterium]|nr:hypothetical protein [Pyrinomonadaceae bacterium]
MISQRCPKCHSNRIRRGYRPTPFWSKLVFRYNLLCDSCNWEFTGFAVPGTVSVKPTRKHKKRSAHRENEKDKNEKSNNSSEVSAMENERINKTFVL